VKGSRNYLFKILSKSGKNLWCGWITYNCISQGKRTR